MTYYPKVDGGNIPGQTWQIRLSPAMTLCSCRSKDEAESIKQKLQPITVQDGTPRSVVLELAKQQLHREWRAS